MADEVENVSRETIRLWRIFRTTKEMLLDRGYELTEEEVQLPLSQFLQDYCPDGAADRARMNFTAKPTTAMYAKYTDPPSGKVPNPIPSIGTISIEFLDSPSGTQQTLGTDPVKKFIHRTIDKHHYTGMIVSSAPPTNNALKLTTATDQGLFEIFHEVDLLVNITRHELVPEHVLLSEEEKRGLLERYRLKQTQLPRIQSSDPVAKYLGLRKGQVVKIIRKSETAGRYASYRWCT